MHKHEASRKDEKGSLQRPPKGTLPSSACGARMHVHVSLMNDVRARASLIFGIFESCTTDSITLQESILKDGHTMLLRRTAAVLGRTR
jgi:hypothetical protein